MEINGHEETTLSEKIHDEQRDLIEILYIDDVKEFIRQIKEDFLSCIDMPGTTKEMIYALEYAISTIDKHAGPKLWK